jgi:hypothetical protein
MHRISFQQNEHQGAIKSISSPSKHQKTFNENRKLLKAGDGSLCHEIYHLASIMVVGASAIAALSTSKQVLNYTQYVLAVPLTLVAVWGILVITLITLNNKSLFSSYSHTAETLKQTHVLGINQKPTLQTALKAKNPESAQTLFSTYAQLLEQASYRLYRYVIDTAYKGDEINFKQNKTFPKLEEQKVYITKRQDKLKKVVNNSQAPMYDQLAKYDKACRKHELTLHHHHLEQKAI